MMTRQGVERPTDHVVALLQNIVSQADHGLN